VISSKHIKAAALGTLLTVGYASPALSAVQTWDWDSSTDTFGGGATYGNTLDMTSLDGTNLTVTAWSDTDDTTNPDSIEDAELLWGNSTSLGIMNRDEAGGSPNHAIDSVSTDLTGGSRDGLLLTFDTSVTLESIDLSWAVGGATADQTDISILAWDGTGSSDITGLNWADILTTNGGNYDVVGNYTDVGLGYYAVNAADVESTTWLIAAYNPTFGVGGDFGDDGFKLDAITTDTLPPPPEVPVPGSVPLVLLGLGLLVARRKLS